MATVRHKFLGTAQIIRRDGDFITIKYDKSGEEAVIKFPEAFTVTNSLFIPDAELKLEIDAIVEAQSEKNKAERAEKEAQRAKESVQTASKSYGNSTKRSSKTTIMTQRTGDTEKDFEHYMKVNGYKQEGSSGSESTVYAYVGSVKSIMKDEGLDWNALMQQISSVVRLYDVGGAKEDIGHNHNKRVINALRRFEDFVNNSKP